MKENVQLLLKLLLACECIAAFTGIIFWNRLVGSKNKGLAVYLIFIAVAELLGAYLRSHGYKEQTSKLYAYLVIPIEFLFAYWYIYKSGDQRRLKKICIWFAVLGITGGIIELAFFKKEKFFFSSFAYLIYSFFLLILVLIFFFDFMKTKKVILWWEELSFWVCAAYLIYYLTTFPLYAFYNVLYEKSKSYFYLCWSVQMFINMGLYLIITLGIIWTSRKLRS